MKMIPTRTFLLKQEEDSKGKMKDVIARKGEAIEVTEKEAKKYNASLRPFEASEKTNPFKKK